MSIVVKVVVTLVSVVVTGVGAFIYKNWDRIASWWTGKRLAVLGAREVGKTHLIKFLSSGTILTEYIQTIPPEPADGRRFQLKDLNLQIKDMLDMSGAEVMYPHWKKEVDRADVVLYLLRADKLFKGDTDYEKRVLKDGRMFEKWLAERSSRPHFFIVGTFCDLDGGEFNNLKPEFAGTYHDKFRTLPVVTEFVAKAGGLNEVVVVVGSMKTKEGTEAIVCEIFKQVLNDQ